MLLFVICVFFHYDLLHCGNENDNFKDGLLDYSTTQYSFMTTPSGHGQLVGHDGEVFDDVTTRPPAPTAASYEEKTLTPLPNITRASYSFPGDKHTAVGPSLPPSPPPIPSLWHINYPVLTPPPNFPSDYRYPTVFRQEATEYSPSPTGPTPRRRSFTSPSVFLLNVTYPMMSSTSHMIPPEDTPRASPTPEPETSPASVLLDNFLKDWKEKQAAETATAAGTTPLDIVPKIKGVFSYDYTSSLGYTFDNNYTTWNDLM